MGAKEDKLKGQGEEAVGTAVGNEDLEAEGKHEQKVGEAEEKVDKAESKADDMIDKAKSEVGKLADKVKDTLHHK
jgi:uncharacterized protein YjbJ (UPF0337 family)